MFFECEELVATLAIKAHINNSKFKIQNSKFKIQDIFRRGLNPRLKIILRIHAGVLNPCIYDK